MASRYPVQAPQAAPSRVGLVPFAALVNETNEDWARGLAYEPETCSSAGVVDPCESGTLTISENPDDVDFVPFGVWAGYKCNPVKQRDWEARAERALVACQSEQVEAEFWSGAQAQDSGWANRFLADPVANTVSEGVALTPVEALAALEAGIADCSCGQRAMIHAPRDIALRWFAEQAIFRDGVLLLTPNDNIVVPGSGYDGSSPDGDARADGSAWVYATSLVSIRLSSISVTGGPDEMDRSANTVEVRAMRAAAATFDNCCHLAAEVDVPTYGIAGS